MLTFFLLCIKHIFITSFRSDFWLEVKHPVAAPCLSGAQDESAAAGGEQAGVHSVFRKSTLLWVAKMPLPGSPQYSCSAKASWEAFHPKLSKL